MSVGLGSGLGGGWGLSVKREASPSVEHRGDYVVIGGMFGNFYKFTRHFLAIVINYYSTYHFSMRLTVSTQR